MSQMMRTPLSTLAFLLLFPTAALADQYDYVLKFADKTTAMADATAVSQTYLDGQGVRQWATSNVVELTVWRNSQDTNGGNDPDGNAIIVHHPLAGYFVLFSLPRVVPALVNHPAVQLVVDRDQMNAGTPGFVLASGVSNAILQDIRFSPVFAGMNPPWGSLN